MTHRGLDFALVILLVIGLFYLGFFFQRSYPTAGAVTFRCGCSRCYCSSSFQQGSVVPDVLYPNLTLCLPSQPWLRTLMLSLKAKRYAYGRAWLSELSIVPDVFLGLNKGYFVELSNVSDKYVLMKLSVIRMLQWVANSDTLGPNEWILLLEDDAFLPVKVPPHLFKSIVEKALVDGKDTGWVYFCSFPSWATKRNATYELMIDSNHSLPVYSYPYQTLNTVAYAITKWRAKLLVEYLFDCELHVHDQCFQMYQQREKIFPLVVFLDKTSRWPGLFGQARYLDKQFSAEKTASVEEMHAVTKWPRHGFLCNSSHRMSLPFGDRVYSAETNLNLTSFLSRFSAAAFRTLGSIQR